MYRQLNIFGFEFRKSSYALNVAQHEKVRGGITLFDHLKRVFALARAALVQIAFRQYEARHLCVVLVADLTREFYGLACLRNCLLSIASRQETSSKIAHRLRFVPLTFSFTSDSDRLLEIILGVLELAAQDLQLTKRVEYSGDVNVVLVDGEVERAFYYFLRPRPLADQHQVDPEIVVRNYRIQDVLGLLKEADRFFKTRYSILRPAKEPVRTRHVGVQLAKHERGRPLANDLNTKLEVLQRFLAVPLLVIAQCDLSICLGHAQPIAGLPKICQRLLGVAAADRTFV